MEVLFTYPKTELFNVLVNTTNLMANHLDNPKLRITDPMFAVIKGYFCKSGKRVLEKIGGHTEGQIAVPYIQTKEGENLPEANAINFTLIIPDTLVPGINIPLIDASIKEFIIDFSLAEWLKTFAIQSPNDLEEELRAIKRALEYGRQPRQKYRDFGI